ncbi:MAG: SDR family NAD(P)-dependent oxidoreductase [Bacteroidetes bacterium]|nr:SDR family NAD(P)-dependent oxidoreductase [Bacteroidota bacterium]
MKILVTGGASGLGQKITEQLATNKDVKVFATYNSSGKLATEYFGNFSNVQLVQCNFKEKENVQILCKLIEDENIDVLVNNAFPGMFKNHFHKINSELFLNSFNDYIIPTIEITQSAINIFRKKKFGKIITILSSFILNKPPIGLSAYVAEKNYLFSLAKSWATENARFNITSNMVSPSFMQTSLNKDTDERILEGMKNDLPLKAFLTPVDVAQSVNFLAFCSQQINGNNIIINQATDLI